MNVLLVSMPFAAVSRPALGLSTLKARLEGDGVRCDVVYPSLAFAARIGPWAYHRIADRIPHRLLAGDWVFTECLYGAADPGAGYLDEFAGPVGRLSAVDVEIVRAARATAPGFLTDVLRTVPWSEYDVVGFGSSCAQNIASLALARRVREAHPSAVLVFGGANWQGEMGVELLKRFPFVDMAFSGEADLSFPAVVKALARGSARPHEGVRGVIYRENRHSRLSSPLPDLIELERVPIPDHGDFFRARARTPEACGALPAVTLETTRGCAWAQRRPCGFCGLDESERRFRRKSPERIIAELRRLGAEYDGGRLLVVDLMVAPEFFSRVLPVVVERPLPMPLFFETRPGLTLEQLRLIGASHADIQPGIESLSDHVLALMGKGSRGLENIRLLKWCRACGVVPRWNVVYGFPGETAADYETMIELMPSLGFLTPPVSHARLSLDRYSPFHEAPEQHGFRDLRPLRAYSYLYPFPADALARITFAFDYRADPSAVSDAVWGRMEDALDTWRLGIDGAALRIVERGEGGLGLLDERRGAPRRHIVLDALDQALYRACENIATAEEAEAYALRALDGDGVSTLVVRRRLEVLVKRRLMVSDGDRCLSLALPAFTE